MKQFLKAIDDILTQAGYTTAEDMKLHATSGATPSSLNEIVATTMRAIANEIRDNFFHTHRGSTSYGRFLERRGEQIQQDEVNRQMAQDERLREERRLEENYRRRIREHMEEMRRAGILS